MSLDAILVTGAEGFIGSHLVETLVKQGRRVRAMVLYNSFGRHGWLDTLPTDIHNKLDIVMGDVRDQSCVREAMRSCDAVMHLAALIAIPYSYAAPASYVETNVMGTLNVLQAARDLGVQKIVHTSTSEVYGSAQSVPMTEAHPLVGQSPYSASKIAADQMAQAFFCSYGTPVATCRPFNTYGPRQSLRAIIPTVILQTLGTSPFLSLGAQSPTRDFNYIDDTVSGMIAVLDNDRSLGETINIGSGHEISIGDTVSLISELIGKRLPVREDPKRIRPGASEVERLCCDNTKAKELLGWAPKWHGKEALKAGLLDTIEWFKKPENRVQYPHAQQFIL